MKIKEILFLAVAWGKYHLCLQKKLIRHLEWVAKTLKGMLSIRSGCSCPSKEMCPNNSGGGELGFCSAEEQEKFEIPRLALGILKRKNCSA